jgi:hypothetical protein
MKGKGGRPASLQGKRKGASEPRAPRIVEGPARAAHDRGPRATGRATDTHTSGAHMREESKHRLENTWREEARRDGQPHGSRTSVLCVGQLGCNSPPEWLHKRPRRRPRRRCPPACAPGLFVFVIRRILSRDKPSVLGVPDMLRCVSGFEGARVVLPGWGGGRTQPPCAGRLPRPPSASRALDAPMFVGKLV